MRKTIILTAMLVLLFQTGAGLAAIPESSPEITAVPHTGCESFVERFNKADLIIAKGQGNYETLNEVDRDIYFLLKAKCPVIARDIGCQMDSLVMRRSALPTASAVKG